MAAALDRLKIVALGGADVPQAGAAALHVDDDARHMAAGHVGNGLLHQRDAAAGGRGHGRDAASRRAQQHVGGGHFAFGLHEPAAVLWQQHGESLGNFILGRDGIAEIAAAARVHRAEGHSLVALDQHAFRL